MPETQLEGLLTENCCGSTAFVSPCMSWRSCGATKVFCHVCEETYSRAAGPGTQGTLVLRDGVYVTEYDVEMKLQGVYVPQTGALHVTLEGVNPSVLMMALDDTDVTNHSASYRYNCLALQC